MWRSAIIGLLVLVVLTACGGTAASGTTSAESGSVAGGATGGAPAPAAPEAGKPSADQMTQNRLAFTAQQSQPPTNSQVQSSRLVIHTAKLRLLVDNVDAAEAQVRKLAADQQGFVLSSQESGQDDQREATISFKVPVDRFDSSIDALTALAIDVESSDVQGQDVTDEFVDLQSRMRNLRLVEARLLDMLRNASNTEDALKVSQELSGVQGQIEQTQGRINYLSQSAAMSTITVSLHAKPVIALLADRAWSPVVTARAAAKNLVQFAQGIADMAIVLLVWLPIWLPLLLLGLWLWRRSRRGPAPVQTPQP